MSGSKEKCDMCNGGTLYFYQWGNYPGESEWRCTRSSCERNRILDEAEAERYEEWVTDTFVNEYGERERY